MPRAVPAPAEAPVMPPSQAGGEKDGETVLDQAFDAASLSELRGAVLKSATAAGVGDERAIDVMLAMHELAANVVRHGKGQGRLLLEITPAGLSCRVSDTSAAPRPAGETALAAPWPVEHGHGLWLVRLTADEVQAVTGPDGSVVTAVFEIPAR
jgi:anti-sigma regulatory factor (Ser/Thr protein kinase)